MLLALLTLASSWGNPTPGSAPWWNASWARRIPVTLDTATLDAAVSVIVPVTVDAGSGFVAAEVEPADVRLVDEAGALLPFEIEGWDAPEGTTFWVDPGPLGPGPPRRIWLYWDVDGLTVATVATEPPPLHWPGLGVWHLDGCVGVCPNSAAGATLDADAAPAPGRIAGGVVLGGNARLRIDLDEPLSPPFVVSAWIWSQDALPDRVLMWGDTLLAHRCDPIGQELGFRLGNATGGRCTAAVLDAGLWQLLAITVSPRPSGFQYLAAVDGDPLDLITVITGDEGSETRIEVGTVPGGSTGGQPFIGGIDEVRIAAGAPSEAQLRAEHHFGSGGGVAVGPAEERDGPGAELPDTGAGPQAGGGEAGARRLASGRCGCGGSGASIGAWMALAWLCRRRVAGAAPSR
jgi:hypothetical protein